MKNRLPIGIKLIVYIAFLLTPLSISGQQKTIRGLIFADNEPLPFANIALVDKADSAIICGTISDLEGNFEITIEKKGSYLISVKFIGYTPYYKEINYTDSHQTFEPMTVMMEPDDNNLPEITIDATRSTPSLKKTAYTFSDKDISHSKEGRELIATLPDLHINAIDNSLATIDGKKVLILINGIKSTNSELKTISPERISKAEYYVVPPMRFADDAEVVVNVITVPQTNGIDVNVDAFAGQLYSSADITASYVNKNNKITANLVGFMNPYRKKRDLENGVYIYPKDENNYEYSYIEKTLEHGIQHSSFLSWTNIKEDKHTLQIDLSISHDISLSDNNSDITTQYGDIKQIRIGENHDSVQTISPTINVYYYKNFNDHHAFLANAVYTDYFNKQAIKTSESFQNQNILYDYLEITSNKRSLIGEFQYEFTNESFDLTIGYKGQFSWLKNITENKSEQTATEYTNTSSHYLYNELSRHMDNWFYGINLGGTLIYKYGINGFSKKELTPSLLIGSNIGGRSTIRFNMSASTKMPDLQQMTDKSILIMDNLYISGNKSLRSYITYNANLGYTYHKGRNLNCNISYSYSISPRKIYNAFHQNGSEWQLRPENANSFSETGPSMSITYYPWEFLRLGVSSSAKYQLFRKESDTKVISNWYIPVSFTALTTFNNFTFSFYQSFGGHTLDGMMMEGVEKISYLNASYSDKNYSIGIKCFFPFINDRFIYKTTDDSPVFNKSQYNLATKNCTFGLSFTWYFSKGTSLESDKLIDNYDEDSGHFSIKRRR